MFSDVIEGFKDGVKAAAASVVRRVRETLKPKSALGGLIADLTRTREELEAENASLRQQVLMLSRSGRKPRIKPIDRVVLILASAFTPTWREALLVVKPETLLRWHRQGFRLLWAHKSRLRKKPQPKISETTIALIKQMRWRIARGALSGSKANS